MVVFCILFGCNNDSYQTTSSESENVLTFENIPDEFSYIGIQHNEGAAVGAVVGGIAIGAIDSIEEYTY